MYVIIFTFYSFIKIIIATKLQIKNKKWSLDTNYSSIAKTAKNFFIVCSFVINNWKLLGDLRASFARDLNGLIRL